MPDKPSRIPLVGRPGSNLEGWQQHALRQVIVPTINGKGVLSQLHIPQATTTATTRCR